MAWSIGWEYEALFDVDDMDRLTPLERTAMMESGDRWKEEETGIRKGRMGYRTRTTTAGPRLEAEIYPIFGKDREAEARQAKKALTPEKIQKHNDEKARRKLIQLMDANFGKGDYHLTLTYGGTAPGWDRAAKDVKNFLERLKRRRRKKGLPELKYIFALEDAEEGREKRIHCHLITQGDMDRREIEEIWGKGFCNCDILQPNERGLEEIARYLYNQNGSIRAKRCRRKYTPSKNLKKPKTRTSDTKVTGNRVRRLSRVFGMDPGEARRIMESLYPGYEYIDGRARGSDVITDGVYVRVLMRKREVGKR